MSIFPLFLLLALEAVLSGLLCVPLKAVTTFALLITGLLRQGAVRIMVGTGAAILSVVLVFSLIHIKQLQDTMTNPVAGSGAGAVFHEARQEIYVEGMNSILIVSCLLLGMTIMRMEDQLRRNRSLETNFEVMMKQAKGTQQEYMRQLDEKAKAQAAAPAPNTQGTVAASAALKEENLALKDDNEKLRRDVRKGDASVAALKKQTEGLQLEFSRLLEENESLRSQLSIFDRKYSHADDKKRS